MFKIYGTWHRGLVVTQHVRARLELLFDIFAMNGQFSVELVENSQPDEPSISTEGAEHPQIPLLRNLSGFNGPKSDEQPKSGHVSAYERRFCTIGLHFSIRSRFSIWTKTKSNFRRFFSVVPPRQNRARSPKEQQAANETSQ